MLKKAVSLFCIALFLSGCSHAQGGYKFCSLTTCNEHLTLDINSSRLFASDVVLPIQFVSTQQFVGFLEPFPVSLPRLKSPEGKGGRTWYMDNYRFSETLQTGIGAGTIISAFQKKASAGSLKPETIVYLSKTGNVRKIIVANQTGEYTLRACGKQNLSVDSFDVGNSN